MYVQTVLDVHKKYNALVMSAFNNDAGFVAALDKVGVWARRPSGAHLGRVCSDSVLCARRPVVASLTTTRLPKWPSRPVNPPSCWLDTATPC